MALASRNPTCLGTRSPSHSINSASITSHTYRRAKPRPTATWTDCLHSSLGSSISLTKVANRVKTVMITSRTVSPCIAAGAAIVVRVRICGAAVRAEADLPRGTSDGTAG